MGSDIRENQDLGGDDETILTQKYDKPILLKNILRQLRLLYEARS